MDRYDINATFIPNCTSSMYYMEALFPRMVEKSEFLADSETCDLHLIPHDSTCFYHTCVFENKRDPIACKKETGDYLENILLQVIHNHSYWNLTGGTDHIMVFSWDQASEVVGWDHPVRSIIQQSIHLTTLGSVESYPNFNPHKDIVIPPFLNTTRALRMFPDPRISFAQILMAYVEQYLPEKWILKNAYTWPNNKRRIWAYFSKISSS